MKCKKIVAVLVILAMTLSVFTALNIKLVEKAEANYYGDPVGSIPFLNFTESNASWPDSGIIYMTDAAAANIKVGQALTVTFNGTLIDTSEVYVYYPEYKSVEDTGSGKNELYVNWTRYDTTPLDQTQSYPTKYLDFTSSGKPNAGLWLVAKGQSALWKLNMSNRTVAYPSTDMTNMIGIIGWFWVNYSTEYSISLSKTTVNYGKESETLTITVKDGSDAIATTDDLFVDIWCTRDIGDAGDARDRLLAYHKYLPASTYGGVWTINNDDTDGDTVNMTDITQFLGAGQYQIVAYKDVSPGTSSTNMAQMIYGPNGGYAQQGASGWNASFGQTDSRNWSGRFINSGDLTQIRSYYGDPVYKLNAATDNGHAWADANDYGTTYEFTSCGPFNPPEYWTGYYNLTVAPGQPTITVNNATNIFWNASRSTITDQINFTVRNYTGQMIDGANLTIKLYNRSNNPASASSTEIPTTMYETSTQNGSAGEWGKYIIIMPASGKRWGFQNAPTPLTQTWAAKGKLYVVVSVSSNGNATDEWNETIEFQLISASNKFEWVHDGSTAPDKVADGELGKIPAVSALPVYIRFKIVSGDFYYWGDGNAGESELWAAENITISGDSLFTGTLDKYPNYNGSFFDTDTWTVPIVPLMGSGGGEIVITAYAWNNTIIGKLSIGGSLYNSNGTVISVTPDEVLCDAENHTLTITVETPDGTPFPGGSVQLLYIDETKWEQYQGIKSLSPIDTVYSSSGTYTMDFNRTRQTTNQTAAGLSAVSAPRNLTVYFSTGSGATARYGYALLEMKRNSGLEVELGRTTMMAGMPYRDFSYTATMAGNSTATPTTADKSQFQIKIYDVNHNDVTATLFSASGYGASYFSGEYSQTATTFSDIYATTPGTYTFYCNNNTFDSAGSGADDAGSHNATLVVKAVNVECDKAPFIWKYDENISATFTVTYNGEPVNGTLRIDNMSDQGLWNRTYTNTSFDGTSDTNPTNTSIEISDSDLVNGQVTVHDITSDALEVGQAMQNITYWFQPLSDIGITGGFARAIGATAVQVPTCRFDAPEGSAGSKAIKYVRVGTTTVVEAFVTGRNNDLLASIYVGLSGQGVVTNATTGTVGTDLGKVTFSIIPNSAGNITVDVGEDGRTVASPIIIVTSWQLDITVSPRTNEGEGFTVSVKRTSDGLDVEDATVEISGIGTATTDANGDATFTAPSVSSDTTYTVTASADGYASDTTTFVVVNVPMLIISGDTTATGGETFSIVVAKDTGDAVIGATVTFNGKEYKTGAGGVVTITAPDVDQATDYDITVTFGDFTAATATITVSPGSPGFELLTLIIALGVAFILLRRRRR